MARKLEVQIVGDASSLNRAFNSASKSGSGFGRSMAGIGKAAAVGFGAVAVGSAFAGKKMVLLASDAAEVDSKMKVVFGQTLPGLTANLDKFSKATGTSRFELREQAADMGALLAPLTKNRQEAANMSAQFVKLATDLGSFNNVPTADALLAIRSGLVGEAEPLRRFGVLLNEAAVKQEALRLGLVKGKQELTEQQKVQARASLIMQQTSLAQGDATRTADSFANQLKRLKSSIADTATEIGLSLLPTAQKLIGFLNDFIQAEGFRAKLRVVWEGVSEVASDLFNRLREAIGGIDWAGVWGEAQGLAESFSSKLQEGFNAIDWGPIGEAIGEGVTKAMDASGSKAEEWGQSMRVNIDGVDWRSIGERVGNEIVGGVGEGANKESGSVVKRVYSTLTGLWIAESAAFLNVVVGAAGKIMPAIGNVIGRGRDAVVEQFDRVAVGGVTGFAKGLQGLAGAVREKFNGMLAQLAAFAGLALNKAYSIGAGIVSGIMSGISGLAGRLAGALGGAVSGAIDSVKEKFGIRSPSTVTAEQIGKPLAEGVIKGFVERLEKARGRFSAAFSTLSSDALAAFDRVTSKMLTPSEKALRDFDRRKEVEGMKQELSDAQADLAQARVGGDADEINAAIKKVADAETALWRDALEQQAQQEREKLDDQNELRRRHFEERLAAMEEQWTKEGVSAKKAHAALMKLLASFGVDFRKTGKAMGAALVEGIREGIAATAAAAAGVAAAGSKIPAGGGAPRSFAMAGGGGPAVVNVYVSGSVTSERDLVTAVRDGLDQIARRNGGTQLA